MGLVIGLGGGNAGGGGGVVANGLIQDMEGVTWTGTAQITDTTITEFPGADFRYCTSLEKLFYNCQSLASVGELKNTGNVTSAYNMFSSCMSLQEVPLFDTANVNSMSSMFNYCKSLQIIPAFDTSNVKNMSSMFKSCSSLESVPAFDTSSVTDMNNMFYGCIALQTVPSFDTANATNMSYMFQNCSLLQAVPLFDTAKVTNMSSMFSYCNSLKTVPALDTSNVKSMSQMFFFCSVLQTIGGINMIKVTSDSNASSIFYNCKQLVTANIANLGVSLDLSWCKVLSIDSMLYLFNNAQSGVSGKTIQLNSLVFDQLTEEQIAIATEKGFSVTSVVRS